MNLTLDQVVDRALQNIVDSVRRDHDAAAAEIKSRGTYWAAGEIARLRREKALLEHRVKGEAK